MIFKKLFKKQTAHIDFSFLKTDIHCHVLPGIDDGAADVHESVSLIESLFTLGFSNLIATPHILTDLYPNTPQTILDAYHKLPEPFKKNIHYAAEYMCDFNFTEQLQHQNKLLVFHQNHVLIEMSYVAETPNIRNIIFDLRLKGYHPVLAHPERYAFYHSNYKIYQQLKEAGCLLQMNLLSFAGYYGRSIKRVAMQLLNDGLIDFAGTDCHHQRHIDALTQMQKQPEMKLLAAYPFLNKELFN